MADILRRGFWEGELVHARRDAARIVVTSRWALQRDENGRPQAILEIDNDITERKHAEEALQQTRAELAHVTRVMTMGEMAASIAHEVNQPLAAVVTNGSACLRWLGGQTPNLEEARGAVGRIIRDANRAGEVIRRIRALLKKAGPERTPLDLNEIIGDVAALAQGEVRRNQGVLRTELAAGLPRVVGDRVQLQQVILNLIMNGVEAMAAVQDRSRELVVRTQRGESGGVLVAVQDSGTGLDAENVNRLFDAFFTTKTQGMGMGLSISRSIVEAHGGRLWATANAGHGATFRFTLPAGGETEA
jgi:C4-dicarboxylate-specific signal transduction histidine kinase